MLRKNNQAYKKYKTKRWQALRLQFLKNNPLCKNFPECKSFATEVDHIVPCETNKDEKFYDVNNLQGLCKSCHSKKTAREDGAFGNVKSRSEKL